MGEFHCFEVSSKQSTMSESSEFLWCNAAYLIGVIMAFVLFRYVQRHIFSQKQFEDSEHIFWANLLFFCQMLNILFVFVGLLMEYSSNKLVPDLIFETVALILIGFIAFGGVDGEIDFYLYSLKMQPSVIGIGFCFHSFWSLFHIFDLIPSYVPFFYVRSCITFDLFIGYKLFIEPNIIGCMHTNSDYQQIK